MPLYGYAFPLATILAIPLLFVRPLLGWPRCTKFILWATVAGAAMLAVSALVQQQVISALVLHYVSFAIFTIAAVKLTCDLSAASQLLAFGSLASGLFYIVIGTDITSDTFEHLWKYGIAVPTAFLATWLAVKWSNGPLVPVLVLLTIAIVSIFLGFRSHGLVCAVSAIIIMAKGRTRRGPVPKVIFASIALYLLGIALPNAINTGLFGEDVQRRTIEQTSSDASFLLAGRVEPPLSFAAISQKPLIGWGNADALDGETLGEGLSIANDLGVSKSKAMPIWVGQDGHISLHSLLFEGWAEGGIVAAIMPAAILVLFVIGIIKTTDKYSAYVVLIAVQGCWDVLFSPWGHNRAFMLALCFVAVAWSLTSSRSTRKVSWLSIMGPGRQRLT